MATMNPLITAADYNAMQATINRILGTGDGDYGYGQTVTSSQLTAGQTITAQHWITLLNDLHIIRMHQKGEVVPALLPDPGVSLVIDNNLFNLIKSTIVNAVADRLLVSTSDLIYPTWYTKNIPGWPIYTSTATIAHQRATHTATVNFGTADNLRNFFNAGNVIEFSAILSGVPTDHKSYAWAKMLAENLSANTDNKYGIGRVIFGRENTISVNPGTGLPSGNGISYPVGGMIGLPNPIYHHSIAEIVTAAKADLGSSVDINAVGYEMYHAGYQYQFGVAPDGIGSFYRITASKDESGSILTFAIIFNDSTNVPGHTIDETLVGSLNSTVTVRRSSVYVNTYNPSYADSIVMS